MRNVMTELRYGLLAFLLLANNFPGAVSAAERITPAQLPEQMRDWVEWVLFPQKEITCPFLYNQFEQHRCAWPTTLELEISERGGKFRQHWQVHVDSWIPLPGDVRRWPQDVRIDDAAAVVTQRNGRPAVRIKAGRHAVSGELQWDRLPESLPIPRETGLITLNVRGQAVATPIVDNGGNLWLRDQRAQADQGEVGDRIELTAFRRVVDDIPLQLVTRLLLKVSGRQREEVINGVLPAQFIPLELSSALPARLEQDGRLRIQVRPGQWALDITARYPGPVEQLKLDSFPAPWPQEEVWSFEARNHLRLVEISGPTAVDPAQTQLPGEWREFPAYLMQPGSTLNFRVIRRGDPEPEPDALTLQRNLWLDFNGKGYTIQDMVSGTMTRGWRLEMNAPMLLGQATLDGQPQFVTTRADAGKPGFEVRRGQINLSADSRYEASRSRVPAVGWDQDFQQVGATLHLPPGWKLFAASGADNVPDTWLKRWTLLDIFLVLIAALAVRGLWQWKAGLLALVALALIWHEPGAPRAIWLHVLAPIALLRVLPESWFRTVATWYRNLALLSLVLIAVPFMVNQVRIGLYPQLDTPYDIIPYDMGVAPQAPTPMPAELSATSEMMAAPEAAMDTLGGAAGQAARESKRVLKKAMGVAEIAQARARLDEVDPDALVQTGPGLPNWQWRRIPLGWNGPVQRDQVLTLTLLSPAMNLFLNAARVLLVVALALVMIWQRLPKWPLPTRNAAALLALAVILPALLLHAPSARADIPDAALLEELKARLTAVPECLPECAQVPRLRVELQPDSVTVRIEIHALEDTAVPLPARAPLWLPAEVHVDGAPAAGLQRSNDGQLWIRLEPGAHQVLLRGVPPPAATFQMPLPLAPRRVEAVTTGWSVEGIDNSLPVGGQLQFTRVKTAGSSAEMAELQAGELPTLVRVERSLRLGLEWRVENTVMRMSPPGSPVVIKVPLMAGESVLTDNVKTEQGQVLVNLGPRDAHFTWTSALAKAPQLTLTAPDTTQWTEIWRADVSPIWHMELDGIAVVHHQDPDGHWLPEWSPWPGETITLEVTRPKGVPGQTLTVDQTEIFSQPGKRATDTTATVTLRSSRGGQHTLQMPEGSQLQSVQINGVAQPIRQVGAKVTLPLVPGTQTVSLVFRDSTGISTLYRSASVDLGVASVNTRINTILAQDRWALMVGGPALGPAVLFWGVLVVVMLIAVGLGRIKITPLNTLHWVLLGIGLTQTEIWVGVIIVGWLLALGLRARQDTGTGRLRHNATQVGLFLLTLLALAMLFEAVKHGLLGFPQMQISGNGSSANELHWYQDRSNASLPQAWILSVPLWVYRGLMLAWALWLAFALLRWLRWGWECFSGGGLWKSKPIAEMRPQPVPEGGEDK